MGFTKLDEGILQSSIIGESGDVFKVWIALLASCREDGIARISPVFLSSVCKLDINTVIMALEKFKNPDPYSRTKEEDGRRIKEVEGGFFVINYHKYRDFNYSSSAEAVRKRKQREKKKAENGELPNPLHHIIVKRFAEGYETAKGCKYREIHQDVSHLSRFLKANPDMTEEHFFKVANIAMADSFHSKNLTIRYICNNFSKIESNSEND